MSELIDAAAVLSRISRHTLRREGVDVTAVAEGVIAGLRQRDPERQVDVTIQPSHGRARAIGGSFRI